MRYPPLVKGKLVKRYKRFLADIILEDGTELTAHCANSGSMKTCMEPGCDVWLSKSDNPKRKLAYSWEISIVGDTWINVNTSKANPVVHEAMEQGLIKEIQASTIRPEFKVGKSRIDFLVNGDTFVEVKSVTLLHDGTTASFPDGVSTRGQKHLRELMELHKDGKRAILFFCLNRTDCDAVRPADDIDPVYGELLREAANTGVEILAYSTQITPQEITIARPAKVLLD